MSTDAASSRAAVADDEPSRRADLGRALLMLLAPVLAFPVASIRAGLLDGGDDALANLPELVYSARMLVRGEVLWTPDLWMGHPLLGEPEFATLYPPHLLFLLGPPTVLYPIYVILHFLFAEGAAYAYLKRLGLGASAAFFGAVAYAFTGFMLGHRGHTMYVCAGAWAPLVLLLFDRAQSNRRGQDFLLGALAFAMLPLCGAVQLTVYLAGTILLLGAARAVLERRPFPVAATIVCLVPAVLVSAVQIAPSFWLSTQLATELRTTAATDMSFHPTLLPTLFLPMRSFSAELYSRIGVVVLCAAWVAVRSWKVAPPAIRAWIVVAGVSLLLMVGAYLPLVPDALGALPMLNILRIPVRHNFELGLSLSVVGAWGFERARAATSHDVRRWLQGGAAVGAASLLAVWVGARDQVSGSEAAHVLRQATALTALGAALAFGVWLLALGMRHRAARMAWALASAAPLLELAWSQYVNPFEFRSFHHLVAVAHAALPESGPVRILSRPIAMGSIDSFGGNSVLFHPRVQSLQGYSSIAYEDARRLLELDMFGQAMKADDLAWSTLPSIFGVTHVVLPHVVCGEETHYYAGDAACRDAPLKGFPPVLRGDVSCRVPAAPEDVSYRLEAGVRAASQETPGVVIGLYSSERRAELFVTGKDLTPAFVVHREPLHLELFPAITNFGGSNEGDGTVELLRPALVEARGIPVAELAQGGATRAIHAAFTANTLRLEPSDEMALVERGVRKPDGTGGAFLELEARALSPSASDLVLDLYGAGGYDPEQAQLVIAGAELGPDWVVRKKEISLDGAPGQFLLRVLSAAPGTVEVRRARLGVLTGSVVAPFPVSAGPSAVGLTVSGERALLAGHGRVGGLLNMPVRAHEVRLDAEILEPLTGALSFGLARKADRPDPFAFRQIAPSDVPRRSLLTFTLHAPPDAGPLTLFSHLAPAGQDQVGALSVHSFEVRDPCAVRGYENPRRLGNGLFLYENPHAAPRAYTASSALVVTEPESVKNTLRAFEPADIGTKVVVDAALPPLQRGKVTSAEYSARSVKIRVESPEGPTLLVVNDRYDPDWAARVDGAAAPIRKVNGIVRGVLVPRGTHRVNLTYVTPAAVWVGVACAVLGALFSLFLAAPLLSRLDPRSSGTP